MEAIPYGREGKVPEQPVVSSFDSALIFKAQKVVIFVIVIL